MRSDLLKVGAKFTNQNVFKQKNEVFGGDSTHERAPPAVLATHCRNLPISSTECKPRANRRKTFETPKEKMSCRPFSQTRLNWKVGKLFSVAQQLQMFWGALPRRRRGRVAKGKPTIRFPTTLQASHTDKKNEVFGGDSTHERTPPAVLATHCRNLPISSTNLKLLT